MSIEALGNDLGIYAGTFVVCFIGGLVPVVNSELWLLGVTMLVATVAPLPAVVALAAAGQMSAKSFLYFGALGATRIPRGKTRARLEKAKAWLEKWKNRPLLLLFTSASVGIPPLYLTTLLAGGLGYRYRAFLVLGFLGRVTRFSVVVALAWTGRTV